MKTPVAASNEISILLSAFYDHMDEAVLISRFDNHFNSCSLVDANPAACELLGYDKEELLTMDPERVLFSNISCKLFNFIKDQLIKNKQGSLEMELTTKNDETAVVELKSSLLEWNGFYYVLSAIKNIEMKKELQDEWLADKNRTLELLNGVQSHIIIMDRSGHIISINKYCEDKTGYSSDELQGMAIWDLLLGDEQKKTFLNNCQCGLMPDQTYESCWVSIRGESLFIQWSVSYLNEDDFDKGYIIGTGIDISQRKDYEKTLLVSTQKYRSLVEDNPDGIVVFEEENMIYLNKEAQKILGYPGETANKISLFSRIHRFDREKAVSYFKGLRNVGNYSHHIIDLEVIRPDSSRVTVEIKGITNMVGKMNFIHLVIRDVSLQKQAESNLVKVNRQMENVLSSTDEIIIGLCKDMRVTFVNQSLVRLLGHEQSGLVGLHGKNCSI
ncbi:PAS domain S-box protein [Bacillus salacetis]|uniref:PAS domain S-box protein n=1 Tax=Bacillus salacetis TaxID=2315464 RepID=A0A3A1QYN6_9BACI|nr:PAS domain S-box protein [Bacillus salacetis]RIW33941.1 PAS domain S-box protein [Bacillus salacetis]